jgi:hypothetical protein
MLEVLETLAQKPMVRLPPVDAPSQEWWWERILSWCSLDEVQDCLDPAASAASAELACFTMANDCALMKPIFSTILLNRLFLTALEDLASSLSVVWNRQR